MILTIHCREMKMSIFRIFDEPIKSMTNDRLLTQGTLSPHKNLVS